LFGPSTVILRAFSFLPHSSVSSTPSSSSTCSYQRAWPLFVPFRVSQNQKSLQSYFLVTSPLSVCRPLLPQVICHKTFCLHFYPVTSAAL
jgi:hypothetical protein